jgi:hypothetical protein
MMKKVLAVLAVLAVAPLANAGTIAIESMTGQSSFQSATGLVSLQLVYSGSPNISSFDVTIDGAKNGAITATGRDTALDIVIAGGNNGQELSGTDDINGLLTSTQMATFQVNYAGGTLVVTPQIVEILDSGFNSIASTTQAGGVTITATPEPVTVALLGLGGLFIRRKMA